MTHTKFPARPASGVPVLDIDPFGHAELTDPEATEAAVRAAGPVAYLPRYGIYAMARYAQVHAALRDWQTYRSGAGVGLSNFRVEKPWRPRSVLLETDPPEHDAPRRVLSAVLGPRAQRRLRDAWTSSARTLVAKVLGGDRTVEVDLVTDLAEAYPLHVFPDAVGMPQEGRDNLMPFSNFLLNAFGPRNALVAELAPRARELTGWVLDHCQRAALADDGFGADIYAAVERGELTLDEAPMVVKSLFAAGVNTTVNSLAAVLYALASHPDQWRRLRAEPRLARPAFEEAVRWASPVQTIFRTTTGQPQVGDVTIPHDQKVLLFLGGANRDPARWTDPEVFDLTRVPSGHVGFGFGLHQCVGQNIARLEAECLLTALVERVATIELTGPPRLRLNNTLRAWDALPARLTGASAAMPGRGNEGD